MQRRLKHILAVAIPVAAVIIIILIANQPQTGDTVEVNVTFPDDYSPNPDLSGAEAVFTVTVNGIYTD